MTALSIVCGLLALGWFFHHFAIAKLLDEVNALKRGGERK